MNKLFTSLLVAPLLCSCLGGTSVEDKLNITNKFNSTWNIYEKIEKTEDGNIVYHAVPWGGLVGNVKELNMPVDWSEYESVTFDFAEPTKVGTQIMVSNKLKTYGKPGIRSLTCYFDGHDVKSVDELALQSSDSSTIIVTNVRLTPNDGVWESTPIWEGNCVQGDWEVGFVIKPEKFNTVREGDKLEIVFTTDKRNPGSNYLIKTIYSGTDQTLEGNANQLNDWGCAVMGPESKLCRIVLTANDITYLRKYGVFINGHYNIVTRCNLLRKHYNEVPDM